MRSGGPFDAATWGIGCVPVDRFLSVQVQVPGATVMPCGNACGNRYVPEGQARERRSFAPSPPSTSARIASDAVQGEKSLSGAPDAAKIISGDAKVPTPKPSPRIITALDPDAILNPDAIEQTYGGRPLCVKYHLNHGSCHCDASQRLQRLHESVFLDPYASKQLAVWASSKACPDGPACRDAIERTCCYWIHEFGNENKEKVADEWISVDKKGKPIVTSAHESPPAV